VVRGLINAANRCFAGAGSVSERVECDLYTEKVAQTSIEELAYPYPMTAAKMMAKEIRLLKLAIVDIARVGYRYGEESAKR